MGCCGWLPCDEEAPLYAESRIAAVARAMSPGIAVHFLRFVIAMKYVVHALCTRTGVFCEEIHKPRLAGKSHQAGWRAQVSCAIETRNARGTLHGSRMTLLTDSLFRVHRVVFECCLVPSTVPNGNARTSSGSRSRFARGFCARRSGHCDPKTKR